jgi:hypothetical protein
MKFGRCDCQEFVKTLSFRRYKAAPRPDFRSLQFQAHFAGGQPNRRQHLPTGDQGCNGAYKKFESVRNRISSLDQ